jgi:glycogen operon protein
MTRKTQIKIRPAPRGPLGAHWNGEGVLFSLFSRHAEAVELCLFDPSGSDEIASHWLPARSGDVWHGYLPGAGPGLVYGYRAHGKYAPRQGHRFNKHKLLLDPYARRIQGDFGWSPEAFGYCHGAEEDWRPDIRDSAPVVPKSVVIDDSFDWQGQPRPATPWNRTVIYETHVKGFTAQHPDVPEQLRGTYLGLAQPAVIEYLQQLGVTAVELLPCQAFLSEEHLLQRGLRNYWGYNPISYFAPHAGYAVSDPVGEFREMVRVLHRSGIEVILDVVFNHTAEGGEYGPTLSFRGIDNASYYLLDPSDLRHNVNFSGCGNTLDVSNPDVLRLVTDALRYWVEDMQVDGFRFDLATSLGRRGPVFDTRGGFFTAIHQDPVLASVKMIAEPWDLGPEGYRLGEFPPAWSEWNDRYRETVRGYWRGDTARVPGFAERIAGSSDLFRRPGREPVASVNYVASHDGFTMSDLVSYERKHNQANREANRDGSEHHVSWNCGVEGSTRDAQILRLRQRQRRNLLATVLLSQGVPMVLAGDEIGRTQSGNNNAYCQDNELSWLDWAGRDSSADMTRFMALLTRIRRDNPVFRRTTFLEGVVHPESRLKDVTWLREDGSEMTEPDWRDPHRHGLGVLLDKTGVDLRYREEGDQDPGHSFLMLFNAGPNPVEFTLPAPISAELWEVVMDTREETATVPTDGYRTGHVYSLYPQSMALLRDPG